MLPTAANDVARVRAVSPTGLDGDFEAFTLVVLKVSDGLITDWTAFLDEPGCSRCVRSAHHSRGHRPALNSARLPCDLRMEGSDSRVKQVSRFA
jgi:hypothetical protein